MAVRADATGQPATAARNWYARSTDEVTTALGVAFTVSILIGALALAAGFQAALLRTGSDDNVIVLRKGADSEISSGITRDAANILRAHPEVAVSPDGRPLASAEVVVLNPPRAGCAPEVVAAVARLRPRLVAYLSCHPGTLARDLATLDTLGLAPIEVRPYDMLPHTPHVEAVALLERSV